MQPVLIEWLKWFKEHNGKEPFIPNKNMINLERKVRVATFGGEWIADGLRHGFGTYYKSLIKDIGKVADYMGNSASMIKRHYAQTIDKVELDKFWGLTPVVVLDSGESPQ